jgi:hypothetical protein
MKRIGNLILVIAVIFLAIIFLRLKRSNEDLKGKVVTISGDVEVSTPCVVLKYIPGYAIALRPAMSPTTEPCAYMLKGKYQIQVIANNEAEYLPIYKANMEKLKKERAELLADKLAQKELNEKQKEENQLFNQAVQETAEEINLKAQRERQKEQQKAELQRMLEEYQKKNKDKDG